MWVNILAMVFYAISIVFVLSGWASGISAIGLIGNCSGLIGMLFSLCILIKNVKKGKSEGDNNSKS